MCVPLTLLAVGNCGLVVALRRSSRIRRRYRVSRSHVDANDRVTSVLISVVVAYVLLVTPAEILMFVERQLIEDERLASITSLVMAHNVANLLQTVGIPIQRCYIRRHACIQLVAMQRDLRLTKDPCD